MAASRSGFPTPPTDPNDPDHRCCPVCGWYPCTRTCKLGLTRADLAALEAVAQGRRDAGTPAELEDEG